jgi:hypothetical protein
MSARIGSGRGRLFRNRENLSYATFAQFREDAGVDFAEDYLAVLTVAGLELRKIRQIVARYAESTLVFLVWGLDLGCTFSINASPAGSGHKGTGSRAQFDLALPVCLRKAIDRGRVVPNARRECTRQPLSRHVVAYTGDRRDVGQHSNGVEAKAAEAALVSQSAEGIYDVYIRNERDGQTLQIFRIGVVCLLGKHYFIETRCPFQFSTFAQCTERFYGGEIRPSFEDYENNKLRVYLTATPPGLPGCWVRRCLHNMPMDVEVNVTWASLGFPRSYDRAQHGFFLERGHRLNTPLL